MSDELKRLGDLWRAVFGEPPPIQADPETLMQILVRCLPTAPPYRPVPDTEPAPPEPLAEALPP